MSLHFHLSHPTTPAGSGFDVDLGAVVALGNVGLQTYATVGDSAGSSVPIDDPTGALDTYTWGLSRFYVVEDESPVGDTVVWNGYVTDQSISRGGGGPEEIYMFGAGRRWQIDLIDDNSILSFRLIGATAGSAPYADRPAENGSARLAWLLTVDHVGSVITDEGLIDWAGLAAIDLDANDYTTSRPKDVCADIAMPAGFSFWCQYDEPSENIQLAFFDANTSTAYTSTLSISNVEADCDYSTVFPPGMDAVLHRSPENVAAGVMVQYAGTPGLYYDTSLPTSYEFGFRDQLAPSSNVKTAAKAQTLTEHYLAQHDEQDEWIDARIWLPADTLTALKAGMRLPVKFSHFPGYEEPRYCRVMEHTLASFNKTEAQYEVQLKLSPQAPTPPPATCSAILSGLDVSEHGPFLEESYLHEADCTTTPADPAEYPSVVLLAWGGGNGYDYCGDADQVSGGYSVLEKPALGPPLGLWTGYKALEEGSPGAFYGNFGNWAAGFTTLSVALPTSATAPVQTAHQLGSGSTATFAAPPSPGNILLMWRFNSLNGTYESYVPTLAGWTLVYASVGDDGKGNPSGGIQTFSMCLYAKCVGIGAGATQTVGDDSFTHWSLLSEWALT